MVGLVLQYNFVLVIPIKYGGKAKIILGTIKLF